MHLITDSSGEVDYLPAMVFPFVKLYGTDEASCFETLATFFLNWGHDWFSLFPSPPFPILSRLDHLLGHCDPALRAALSAPRGGVQLCCWSILQTLFTEILDKDDWLKVSPAKLYTLYRH